MEKKLQMNTRNIDWDAVIRQFRSKCIDTNPKMWKILLLMAIECKRSRRDIVNVYKIQKEWNKNSKKWKEDELTIVAVENIAKRIESSGITQQIDSHCYKVIIPPDEVINAEIYDKRDIKSTNENKEV